MNSKITCALILALVCILSLTSAIDLHHKSQYKAHAKPYHFSYGVKNSDHYGANFGQQESSDGNTVRGSYTVQLPDGRQQLVEYEADHHKGFVAKVSYKGYAQYPSKVGPPFIVKPSHKYH